MAASESLIRLLRADDAAFEEEFRKLEERRQARASEIDEAVAAIVQDVRQRGDDALLEATERFDGYRLTREEIVLSEPEVEQGVARLPQQARDALEAAAERLDAGAGR